jgi:hypothetical protein
MQKLLLASALVLSLMASPCLAIEWTIIETGNFEISFGLKDVPEPLITAAMMIEFDPTALEVKIGGVTFNDVWDQGMSSSYPVPQEPGKYVLTAGNLSNANPDNSSNIGVASVQFQCLTGNCSGQQIKVHTVPGFDSVVGSSSGVFDSQIDSKTFTIMQGTTTTAPTKDYICVPETIYGEHSQEVQILRYLRDNILSKTQEGQELIRLYYQWSSVLVKAMEEDEAFKQEIKDMIDEVLPMIAH